MKKIKFAVLGCGHIGKRHAELIANHPHAELVSTIDPAYNEFQVGSTKPTHFQNLSDFLKQNLTIDVVNVCSPNGLHAKQAIQCLNQGYHVVVEKPIALNLSEANCILEAANRNDKYVFPVVQNRYSSTVKWLKQIVDSGALGKIYMVQLNCFWNRDDHYYKKGSWHGTLELDGGPLFTQFSHFIDVLNWTFGKITNIDAHFSNFNHQQTIAFEDSGLIRFNIADGAVGTISYSTSVFQSNFESSITVIAENGTLKIGGQYMNSLEYCQIKGKHQPVLDNIQLMNNYGAYKGSASNHQQVINNVVNSLNGLEEPDVSLQEGINVVESISAIYEQRNIEKFLLEKEKLLV